MLTPVYKKGGTQIYTHGDTHAFSTLISSNTLIIIVMESAAVRNTFYFLEDVKEGLQMP